MSVTFFDQKNGQRLDTRNVEKVDSDDNSLCCVRALAVSCHRIATYDHPCPILQRNICLFQKRNKAFTNITSALALKMLRSGTEKMGFDALGFYPNQVGTHSIRSGGAMAYFLLPELSDSAVMFKGRWKSTAFLSYIRPQVDQCMKGHASKIVANRHWYNVPALDPTQIAGIAWGNNSITSVGGGSLLDDARLLKDEQQKEKVKVRPAAKRSKQRPSIKVDGGRERARRLV